MKIGTHGTRKRALSLIVTLALTLTLFAGMTPAANAANNDSNGAVRTVGNGANGTDVTKGAAGSVTMQFYANSVPTNVSYVWIKKSFQGKDQARHITWENGVSVSGSQITLSADFINSLDLRAPGVHDNSSSQYTQEWYHIMVGALSYNPNSSGNIVCDAFDLRLNPPTVTLAFNRNGGGGSNPANIAGVINGMPSALPGQGSMTPPEGKEFKGWGLTAGAEFIVKSPVLITDMGRRGQTVTYYAVWGDPGTDVGFEPDMRPVTLTYKADGQSDKTVTEEYDANRTDAAVFTLLGRNTFNPPEDKQLRGWNTQADGGGTAYALGQKVPFGQNTTLFAVWGDAQAIVRSIDTADAEINLSLETITLPAGFNVAAYSLDGGTKWKKGSLPEGKKLDGLFNKGFTLAVTDLWNDKDVKEGKKVLEKKGVAKEATVIKFPKIDKRPKGNAEKLAPFYSNESPDKWVMTKKGAATYTEPSGTYEWAATGDGKNPDGEWQLIPDGGWDIAETGTKTTVLFRSAATADTDNGKYTPSSKVFKVKPAAFLKEPKYKAPSEKKGKAVLKLKKGDFCKLADGTVFGSLTAATTLNIVYTVTDSSKQIQGGASVTIWKAATGKKPRSAEQKDLTMPDMPAPESAS
ncbi:MAG: InlB B-repeat-containing protein [Oscillospiraceae bacterium]|nr:InlB B-repeat-containing protein [Oscillospiraceae bacterium]